MDTILITGATGFIGGHMVRTALERGYNVRTFTRKKNEHCKDTCLKNTDIFYGDIRDYNAVEKVCKNVDIIVHMAGLTSDWGPQSLFKAINVDGTENICKGALKNNIKHLINISTCDVFDYRETKTIDESMNYSYWKEPYPDTKINGSKIVWQYHQKGLPITQFYPCWVYGEGDKTFLPLIADAIMKKDMLFWRKNPIVWPTYINNLMDLIWKTIKNPKALGHGFLVHDGESDSIEGFTEKVAQHLDLPVPTLHIPYWAAIAAGWAMENTWKLLGMKKRPLLTVYSVKNLGATWKFSIDKAKTILDWQPPTPYLEGLKTSLDWLQSTPPDQWKSK